MRLRKARHILAALCLAASSVAAEDWNAIVVGQPGGDAPKGFSDAFNAGQALEKSGFASVTVLQQTSPDVLLAAVAALQDSPRALIFFSGPLRNGAIQLHNVELPFDRLLDGVAAAGVRDLALLIEDCADIGASSRLSIPSLPEGMAGFIAASAGPGGSCAATPIRLTDRLQDMANATSLQDALTGTWNISTLDTPIPVTPPPSVRTVATPSISVVSTDVVTLSPVAAPVQATPALAPVRATPAALRPQAGSSSVIIFDPPAQSQLAAIPVAAGQPDPYIIVGLIDPVTNASFDTVPDPGQVSSTEITYENLELRRNLRDTSPELFAQLVSNGAFDPPESLLPRALQTELARMGCYTAGIDGIWGGGSRRSVERYFAEIPGVSAVSLEPEFSLFRQIIRQDDIVCEVPQARPAVARSTGTTTRSTPAPTRRAATPAPTRRAAPAPARTQSGGRTIQTGRSLGGVFR